MSKKSSCMHHLTLGGLAIIVMLKFCSALSLPPQENVVVVTPQQSGKGAAGQVTNGGSKDHVMYSYSEANINKDGIPVVRQLTIFKGKDGQVRFAKNENGTVETGKWEGAIPTAPSALLNSASSTVKMIEDQVKKMTDPLATLNQRIGSSLQDYILKSLKFF